MLSLYSFLIYMTFENLSNNRLTESFQDLWGGIVFFVPNLVVAILIVLIGWVVGALLGRIISQLIRSLKIDEALRKAGIEDVVRRGGIVLDSGHFIGSLVKWFVIVAFLITAFDVLGLVQINKFLNDIVLSYIPQVIIAALVLIVAGVLGDVMRKIVVTSAKAAGVHSSGLAGNVTKWSIWIFAILVALSNLGIASSFIQTLFTGVVVAFSIALGLAFGLGGQEAAARFIEKTRNEISHHDK